MLEYTINLQRMKWAVILLAATVSGFEFTMLGNAQRCFLEELVVDARFRAKYSSSAVYNQFLDVTVQEPSGSVIFHDKAHDSGHIDVYAQHTGYHQLCFTTRAMKHSRDKTDARVITLDVHAFAGDEGDIINYNELARREHLQPIEMNLRLIDENLRIAHGELHNLRRHEAAMSSSISTSFKVLMASAFGAGVVQLLTPIIRHYRQLGTLRKRQIVD